MTGFTDVASTAPTRPGISGSAALRRKTQPARAAWEWPILTLMAAIVFYQVLIPPIVGLANNGDFERIMGQVGLEYTSPVYEDRYFAYVNTKYQIVPRGKWVSGYITSESIPVEIALFANRLLSKDGLFDIRILGTIHATIFIIGMGLLLWAMRSWRAPTRVALAILLVFIFTDVAYIAYFNSIYSEPSALLFLPYTLGAALLLVAKERPTLSLIAAYFISAALFVLAKPQNSPLGILLAIFGIRLCWNHSGEGRREAALILGLGLLFLSIAYYQETPQHIREETIYNNVFYEILNASPSPEDDLLSLGLDPALAVYAGTTVYTPADPINDPMFRNSFFNKLGYAKILQFYATHPQRLVGLMRRSLQTAPAMRPEHHGNFEKVSAPAPGAQSQAFAVWSGFKERFLPKSTWFLPGFFLVSIGAAIAIWARSGATRHKSLAELFILLNVMSGSQFLVALLGQGRLDLTKHLFLFHLLFDSCLVFVVVWATTMIWSHVVGSFASGRRLKLVLWSLMK